MTGPHEDQGDWGEIDLDPQEQAEADINLDDPSAGDNEPWSPPDRQPRGAEMIGVETDGGETLGQRISQEVPEPDPYAEPSTVGGQDPDAIRADRDVLGGPVDADRPVEGHSPEESAMRVVEDDPLSPDAGPGQ